MEGIIQTIKRNTLLHKIGSGLFSMFICISSRMNPEFASKVRYRYYLGKPLNLDNPSTLNEKMMYLKLKKYWNSQFVADRADKFAVRKIILDYGCPEILNEIYGAWDKVENINWEALPEKFVIKCNHGSGYNIVCHCKATFDIKHAEDLLGEWMKKSYGISTVEQGIYRKIKRKIIAEKFIETIDNKPPKDYKFFCSYGDVKFLFIASDRVNDETKFDYYYPDWTWIPVKNQHPNVGPIDKPKMLDRMIHYAKILSKDLPLVRVDLYNEGTDIIFGEFTFTHFGCLNSFNPDSYDLVFGKCFPSVKDMENTYLR